MKKAIYILCSVLAVAYIYIGYEQIQIHNLKKIVKKQNAQIEASKMVYFYNLEEVLRATNAISAKTNFESEILKLNDEVFAAEKKIKSIKDAKVKADFSDVYLNTIKLKREELIKKYDESIKTITDGINKALAEVAAEKGVATIFVQSAIAVNTAYTEDVTDEIIKRLKKMSSPS